MGMDRGTDGHKEMSRKVSVFRRRYTI